MLSVSSNQAYYLMYRYKVTTYLIYIEYSMKTGFKKIRYLTLERFMYSIRAAFRTGPSESASLQTPKKSS
jgi:hypothetical protein